MPVFSVVVLNSLGVFKIDAHIAQSVEHILGKDEVTSSSLVVGSTIKREGQRSVRF